MTPRDAGSPFFAVSIKYRVNVYLPDGKLADSWGFTGYGTSPAQGLSSTAPLAAATALAMRDAGAKLAVEFREQAIVRGLLPAAESVRCTAACAPGEPESPPAGAPPAKQPDPQEEPTEKDKQEEPEPEAEAFARDDRTILRRYAHESGDRLRLRTVRRRSLLARPEDFATRQARCIDRLAVDEARPEPRAANRVEALSDLPRRPVLLDDACVGHFALSGHRELHLYVRLVHLVR